MPQPRHAACFPPGRSLLWLGALALAACTGRFDPERGDRVPDPSGRGGAERPGPAPGGGGSSTGSDPSLSPGGGASPGPSGPSSSPPSSSSGAACAPGPTRIWPLTPDQYLRSVRAVLPGAEVGPGLQAALAERTGFSNEAARLGLTEPYVGELLDTVHRLATAAAATPAALAPCLGRAPVTEACQREVVEGLGARAFRRPLTAAEAGALSGYLARQSQAGGTADPQAGLRRLLMYLFTSPSFVYRTELGAEGAPAGRVELEPFERAAALSYFLADGPPDAQLFEAARTGGLADPTRVEAEARRLLASASGASGLLKLFHELFDTGAARVTEKDPQAFPAWNQPLGAALARESEAFVERVLWGEDARLSTLLTGSFSMLDASLAAFYGLPAPNGGGLTKVAFPAGQRAGILTQAGRLAALAKVNDTDAVSRGRFVREVLLCQHLPAPPDTVNAVPPPPDGQRTQRERLGQHSSDPSCAGCHDLMDPLGLAFEIYDGVGRHRSSDVGKPIDASGVLSGAEPEGARFTDAVALAGVLARSPSVSRCLVETTFRYALGRAPAAADRCALDRLNARFQSSGGDLKDLAVAIATDPDFLARTR